MTAPTVRVRGPRRLDLSGVGYNAAALALAIGVAVVIGGLAVELSGHSALHAYNLMVQYAACNTAGSGGDPCTADSVIDIINRAIPYYLSALAVAIGFRMALFNIGVEGQYRLAAVITAIAGVEIHLPAVFQIPLLLLIAMAVGAVWAGIAGILKVTRGVSEVISTIMLNYIAYGLIAFILSSYLSGNTSNNLSSATPNLPAASQMPGMNRIFHDLGLLAPHDPDQISGFLVVIAIIGTAFYFIVERSRFGFDLRASGINPWAAQAGGVSSRKMILITMLISGALAGLVGLPYLLGQGYNYSSEFPANLGFNGIAVALLGRNKPIGIAFAALLWGFLERSAQILDLNNIPQEIYVLMQGSIVLAVVVAYEIVRRAKVRRAEREVAREVPEALGGAVEVTA
ncbi:ABC transporter permease [Acidothermaceae bacterium B102]|nr:ABC transporter permease [Acidothermaceae bacterium B102]